MRDEGGPASEKTFDGADRPYVLLVEFDLKPGAREAFMPLMLENARRSLADEPGCFVFDVLTRSGQPDHIVLYEIYRNREAFEQHLVTPHFLAFDATTGAHVVSKRVCVLDFEDAQ